MPCKVEFRSRLVEAGSTGAPREYGARLQGRPSFAVNRDASRSFLTHNNFYPPILRLSDITRSLHQRLALAPSGRLDQFGRDAAEPKNRRVEIIVR